MLNDVHNSTGVRDLRRPVDCILLIIESSLPPAVKRHAIGRHNPIVGREANVALFVLSGYLLRPELPA